jgi:hypothetical protein
VLSGVRHPMRDNGDGDERRVRPKGHRASHFTAYCRLNLFDGLAFLLPCGSRSESARTGDREVAGVAGIEVELIR